MKVILATAVSAALLIATPALAAKRVANGQARAQSGEVLYAPQAPAVISGDKVLGQDPDPTIRTQIMQQGDISAY